MYLDSKSIPTAFLIGFIKEAPNSVPPTPMNGSSTQPPLFVKKAIISFIS